MGGMDGTENVRDIWVIEQHHTHTHLSGDHSNRPSRPGMNLVIHKMLQPLVERRTKEDEGCEGSPGVSVVHTLVSVLLIGLL